ncbi:MAG TPA: hypothetical protein VIV11_41685, partial [Kofleriaceae bacterium]
MIGAKSIAAIFLAAFLVAVGVITGKLAPSHLAHLSPGACFAVGLLASLALGLTMAGWRPDVRSAASERATRIAAPLPRASATTTKLREAEAVAPRAPRELPATAQRVLVLVGFASIALVAIDNHAAARIADYPRAVSEPTASTYCLPQPPEEVAAPAPPPPPEEQPGCALVKRAYQLGYRKSLGDCAPKQQAVAVVVDPVTRKEICERRQLDEPWLHYAARKVGGAFGAVADKNPVEVAQHQASELRTHVDFLPDRLADIKHSITGTPHAAHHVWINLPNPHPGTLGEKLTGAPRCEERFEHLPLWPRWTDADRSRAVEHVLGQLLFAARFGTTASCADYVIHWDAPADACTKLAADPIGFLDGDALASVRGVLDRRRRQIAVGELTKALGRPEPRTPPPAAAVVSLHCFSIDPAGTGVPTGKTIAIDGDELGLREVRVREVKPTGAGPIDIYRGLAALFAGTFDQVAPDAGVEPSIVEGNDFMLTRIDALSDADPFRGARWPLE